MKSVFSLSGRLVNEWRPTIIVWFLCRVKPIKFPALSLASTFLAAGTAGAAPREELPLKLAAHPLLKLAAQPFKTRPPPHLKPAAPHF